MEGFSAYIQAFLDPAAMAAAALGTVLGALVGAIPGLTGTMAVSLLTSLTFAWRAEVAIALIIGVFVGVVFGGSRPAILLNIPGAPAAVATGFDGYPLAQKGLAAEAMGLSTVQSFLGTVLGILFLAFLAPPMGRLALSFRSTDRLLLVVLALLICGGMQRGQRGKGLISALAGLFLGTVGIDPIFAVKRFTGGVAYLNGGVSFIVVMIGLFGASEAFSQLASRASAPRTGEGARVRPSWRTVVSHLPLTLQSAVLGAFIGALPGAGGDVAALLSYDLARRTVKKNAVPFGSGAVEGVIAPETANNAAIGGALVPMLTLGIPGDAVTAVLLGALSMHGIVTGPDLMSRTPELFYLILAALSVGAVCLLAVGLFGSRIYTRLFRIPKAFLMPAVLVISMVGAYAVNGNVADIFLMLGFGLVGLVMKRFRFPTAPLILGILLSALLESNLLRALMAAESTGAFLLSLVNRPLSLALTLGIAAVIGLYAAGLWKERKKC